MANQHPTRVSTLAAALALSGLALPGLCGMAAADERPALPEPPAALAAQGFEQLLPRGKIAALVDPEFVAAKAAEIPDTAWILGYVDSTSGEAYAYDLNILNAHEIVNHRAGEHSIAAVW